MSKVLESEMETRIRAIILRQLEGVMRHPKVISVETPILGNGLGLDSLETLTLVTQIEAEFGILIDDDELTVDTFKNIGTLADYVSKKLSGNKSEGKAG